MNNSKSKDNLRALVESALLVALGFVLSHVTLFRLPNGGSVTPLSMLPLLMVGLRWGIKWGLCAGLIYGCLQMFQSLWAPPSGTAVAWISMISLDYLIAFTVLGLSGIFAGRKNGIIYAVPLCLGLRFLSHFISGVFIWGHYFDAESWIVSLTYNASYMGPEIVITFIAGIVLYKTAPTLFQVRVRNN